MPIKEFECHFSKAEGSKIDTSLFVLKSCLRTNDIESNVEEDLNIKNENYNFHFLRSK